MGTAQSVEEQKCPLPGKPFVATANNVVNATEKATQRKERIQKDLLEPSQIGDTISTSRNSNETEPPHSSQVSTELQEWRGEKRKPTEPTEIKMTWRRRAQQGGMEVIKKLHVKELRELLKENRIKVTHKGKYLSKKQMINKLKMIKWN